MDSTNSNKFGFQLFDPTLFWAHIYEALPVADIVEAENLFRRIGFIGSTDRAPNYDAPVSQQQLKRLLTGLASIDESWRAYPRDSDERSGAAVPA